MKGRPRLALFLGLAVVGVAVFLLANTLRAGPAVQRLAMDKTISSWSSAGGLEVSAHLVRDEIELRVQLALLNHVAGTGEASDSDDHRVASTANPRLRIRVVGPTEMFLVEVEPRRVSGASELRGQFRPASWDRIGEYSIEVTVFTFDFVHDIEANEVLTNATAYYRLNTEDLPIDELEASIKRQRTSEAADAGATRARKDSARSSWEAEFSEKDAVSSTPTTKRRWLLRDEELVEALRCTRKPDAAAWCAPMPDRIWNRYFAAWYIPPPAHELEREALQLDPRAPRRMLPDDRRACFFGDSQMRHLFNNFVMAMSGYAAVPVASAEKEVMPSDRHSYAVKRWAGFDREEGAVIAIDSMSCTDIVVNMGQWPAGWPEGRPWSFLEYEVGVRSDLEELRALAARLDVLPKRLYWLSTNPHGYMDMNGRSMYGPDAVEWRWDAVVDGYNGIARAAALASGIKYVDVSGIVKPLADLPYDGAHYAGIVGDEMAWELIKAMVDE